MERREDKADPTHPQLAQELERALAAERKARGDAEILRQALEAFTSRSDVDQAVFKAKCDGRNRIVLWSPSCVRHR